MTEVAHSMVKVNHTSAVNITVNALHNQEMLAMSIAEVLQCLSSNMVDDWGRYS